MTKVGGVVGWAEDRRQSMRRAAVELMIAWTGCTPAQAQAEFEALVAEELQRRQETAE